MILPAIDGNRTLFVRTMNGIGDWCWAAALLAGIKSTLGVPSIIVKMQRAGDFRDDRALEFVRRFDFIDFAFSERFEIHRSPAIADNRIQYIESGYNADRSQYTLIPNAWIEWDAKLSELGPCDWSFMRKYRPDESGERMAASLCRRGTIAGHRANGYLCVHLGAKSDNSLCGQNIGGAWSVRHWAELFHLVRDATDLPVYVLGSEHDSPFAAEMLAVAGVGGVVNLCGKTTTTEAVEVLRRTEAIVSFASGLPIVATYMGVPTVCFWNPEGRSVSRSESYWFSDAFATNWVSPDAPYRAAVYTRDNCNSVFAKLLEVVG